MVNKNTGIYTNTNNNTGNNAENKLKTFLVLLLALSLIFCFTACGGNGDKTDGSEEVTEETTAEEPVEEELPEAVTTIDGIDTDLGPLMPLQIQSVTLYKDGTVALIPTDDLLRIAESNNEVKDGVMYPFADSGKVKQIYLTEYGNGGYRTIVALIDDGTLSAVNGNALVEDHIIAVVDTLGGRDNFTGVEERTDETSHYFVGITDDGQEVILDDVLESIQN